MALFLYVMHVLQIPILESETLPMQELLGRRYKILLDEQEAMTSKYESAFYLAAGSGCRL